METLIIHREQIEALVDTLALGKELTDAFVNYSAGLSRRDGERIVLDIDQPNKATVLGPGTSRGIPAYTVKINSKFPGEALAIKGIVALFDIRDGALLALLDSSSVTAIRTGLCAALATDRLARPDARTLGIVGAGKQNLLQLGYLLSLRQFQALKIYDVDPARAALFKSSFENRLPCELSASVDACVRNSDVVLSATWSRAPLIHRGMVSPGCHITSLGSDEKGKVELAAELVLASRFYCDDIPQNMQMGTPGNLGLPESCIENEIGAAFANPAFNRGKHDITVYSCVGLPFQDLVTCWHVYQRALRTPAITQLQLT